jgi:hypothetical protein
VKTPAQIRVRFSFGASRREGGHNVRKHVVALCILALCLAIVSCAKLRPTGPLTNKAEFTDAIPQDYGPLIGVTQNPEAALVCRWQNSGIYFNSTVPTALRFVSASAEEIAAS